MLGLMLVKLFGARLGLVASLPVAGGLLAGLAAAGITGTPVNLLQSLRAHPRHGIGVDYTIFFHSEEGAGSADEPRTTSFMRWRLRLEARFFRSAFWC